MLSLAESDTVNIVLLQEHLNKVGSWWLVAENHHLKMLTWVDSLAFGYLKTLLPLAISFSSASNKASVFLVEATRRNFWIRGLSFTSITIIHTWGTWNMTLWIWSVETFSISWKARSPTCLVKIFTKNIYLWVHHLTYIWVKVGGECCPGHRHSQLQNKTSPFERFVHRSMARSSGKVR